MKIIKSKKLVENILNENEEVIPGAEIKASGDGVDTEVTVAITDKGVPETKKSALKIDNALTKQLDIAINEAYDALDDENYNKNCNVLIRGLPGSSKTRSIEQWAANNNINIYYLDAKNPDINILLSGAGAIDRSNPEYPKVVTAYSNAMKQLDRPNSVLFLDELNRQVRDYLRGSLLTLIESRKIAGPGEDGFRYFPNLLFTIAAVNPPENEQERRNMRLNSAERRRFYYRLDFNSEVPTTTEFLSKYYDDKLKSYAANPDKIGSRTGKSQADRVKEAVLEQWIGKYLVNHKDFHYSDMDTFKGDIQQADEEDMSIVCQSIITELLSHSHGKIENIKRDNVNTLKRGREMINNILDTIPPTIYTDDFLDKLIAKKAKELRIDLSFAMSDKKAEPHVEEPTKVEKSSVEPSEEEETFDFSGQEDDTDFGDADPERVTRSRASDAAIGNELRGVLTGWEVE